jgi:uncharacterized membrane protein
MTALIAGLVVFLGVHSLRIVADGWRTTLIEKTGISTYRAMHGALSLLGLVLIIAGYGAARTVPVTLWQPPGWAIHLAILLTIPSFVLLAASVLPGTRIRNKIGHPLFLGVKVWALAHLMANGTLADLILFGAFLLWSVFGYASAQRRDRKAGTVYVVGSPWRDVAVVIGGLVAWVVFALWLHTLLIGVAPLSMGTGA